MKKAVWVCVSFVAAASLLAAPAEAQEKRRKSFFEALFGFSPKKKREARRAWWEEDEGDVRIIRGGREAKKKRAAAASAVRKKAAMAAVAVDPDVAAGHGFGNLTYAMPVLAPVVDRGFLKLPTAGTEADSIRLALADRETDIRAVAPVRKAVLDFYKDTGFRPVWMKDGQLTDRGQALLSALAGAKAEGLTPERYLPPVLTDFTSPAVQVAGSALAQAQLDIGLTVAAVTYAQHVSGGAFEPERLSLYHDVKPTRIAPDVALRVLAFSPYPAQYLASLAPKHPAYAALKAELARIDSGLAAPPAHEPFPAGPLVKLGQRDSRIILLRQRLAAEGLIAPVTVTDENRAKLERLDKALSAALRTFQQQNGVKASGLLGDGTVAALNGAVPDNRRGIVAINMERLRWLPKDLGRRYVFVNQAAQRLELVENDVQQWATNVVVGKPTTQTNVFSDRFDDIVINPSWTMPQGIFLRDYLGKLRSNASYVDKKGYKVYDKNGKVIPSRAVNWNAVGTNSPFRITQPPGESNALGTLKFNFPNRHAIYLHDTPMKELFTEQERTFSNGCVRVEHPSELAAKLLGMAPDKLAAMIDEGATRPLKVKTETFVHLYYFTAWPAADGSITYFRDSYERDKVLLAALNTTGNFFSRAKKQQMVENRQLLTEIKAE